MPNTKSAERRMRNSARKSLKNQATKSRLKTAEKRYQAALAGGNAEAAQTALNGVASAYDKAAKSGVIHKGRADRKKSRLAHGLKTKFPAPAAS